jgi:predicted RNase H-like nuclease
MTPEVHETVREVHPELCFYGLTGKPMDHKKKSAEGKTWRLRALYTSFPGVARAFDRFPRAQVASDDVLDACAAAWTAARIADNSAKRIPAHPPTDAKNLRMEMWY